MKRENFLPVGDGEVSFVETLVRYGQRVQSDRASQVTSLWGDAVMEATTAKPQVPAVVEDPQITRLEREKDLVGLYLSAHPLDPYKLELDYACTTGMSELKNRNELIGKDLTFGGVIVGYREKVGKNGNPYAFLKIEDYTGSDEIPLFGRDYVKYSNFGRIGNATFVMVRATYERSKYNNNVNLVIKSIDLLADLQGKIFSKLAITLPLHALTPAFIDSLSEQMHETLHNSVDVSFRIIDTKIGRQVSMRSRRKCKLTRELIDFLKEWDASPIEFKLS